jgi:hypothetical protein
MGFLLYLSSIICPQLESKPHLSMLGRVGPCDYNLGNFIFLPGQTYANIGNNVPIYAYLQKRKLTLAHVLLRTHLALQKGIC